ncbi:MAG: hypothetical protein V8T56_00090 [Parasutterella sp.]|uniref:hypothetical protein n=1 Tax=Parasutterella sp. TaxID=2049037 RepID=UPI00300F122C
MGLSSSHNLEIIGIGNFRIQKVDLKTDQSISNLWRQEVEMGYNRYIYSDATLKAKAANNKVGLLKNKKRSDIVAYGTELVLSQIKYEPKSYLEYGPYWWAMKKVINARGGNLGRQLPAFFYSLPRGSLKTATVA